MERRINLKKGDLLWAALLLSFIAITVLPVTHEAFMKFTTSHPYLGGFTKFAILATMGELLALRISSGNWNIPVGLAYRAIIWGVLGIVITLIFNIYGNGVAIGMEKGLIPGGNSQLVYAFLVSAIMNTTFAPTFMAFHRATDTYLDLRYTTKTKVSLKDVINQIDWHGFISFVVLKTIPFFWIPAHTITFLMPNEYRVLMAAALSIALGGILAFAKRRV